MKKYMILLVMSVLLACGSQAGYVLKGVFENAGNGRAVLIMDSKGKTVICDTVEMKGGTFVFKGVTPEVGWAMVEVMPEANDTVRIRLALENSRIEMRGNWENVGLDEEENVVVKGIQISGSRNQDVEEELNSQWNVVEALPEFREYARLAKKVIDNPEVLEDTAFYWTYRKEFDPFMARVKEEQLKIIAANPSAVMAASWLVYMMNEMTLEELERIFGQFDAKVQQSELAREVRESIELRQRIEPGRLAPEFTLAQRDSSLLSLSDLRGKVVILDFWASWCKPCRASFAWVREFYKEYREKGVEIVGVSIDANKTSWKKALDAENLPWPQLIDETVNGNYLTGELYHVMAVPMFVVIDKEGKIAVRAHMEKEQLVAEVEKALAK